jgi:hypothetical protein
MSSPKRIFFCGVAHTNICSITYKKVVESSTILGESRETDILGTWYKRGHNGLMGCNGLSPAPPLITRTTRTYPPNTGQYGAIRTYTTSSRAHIVGHISGSIVGRLFALSQGTHIFLAGFKVK